jgi:putative ABC transport system permease protein
MGAGLAPMLGSLSHGPAGGSGGAGGSDDSVVATGSIGWGWTVPVIALVLAMTVGGVLLDQVLRRRIELSVRLRDAEFE